jgi:hypothetical protein
MNCDNCRQPIADDAPVYRLYENWGSYGRGVHGWVCERCGERVPTPKEPPVPCIICGRPVIYDARRRAEFAVCSERCSRVAVFERQKARAQRKKPAPEQRTCAVGGQLFIPKRKDAAFCSSACRQKAYRDRRIRASSQRA